MTLNDENKMRELEENKSGSKYTPTMYETFWSEFNDQKYGTWEKKRSIEKSQKNKLITGKREQSLQINQTNNNQM